LSKITEQDELVTLPKEEDSLFQFDDGFEDKDKDEHEGIHDENIDDEITQIHKQM